MFCKLTIDGSINNNKKTRTVTKTDEFDPSCRSTEGKHLQSSFEVAGGQWIKGHDQRTVITAAAGRVSQGDVSRTKAREEDKGC